MLSEEGLEEEDGGDAADADEAEVEDGVSHSGAAAHDIEAVGDHPTVAEAVFGSLLGCGLGEGEGDEHGQGGDAAADDDGEGEVSSGGHGGAQEGARQGGDGEHAPGAAVDAGVVVLPAQRFQGVVQERRLGSHQEREADAPYEVGDEDQLERGSEAEQGDGGAEGAGGGDERRLATPSVGDGGGGDLEGDDAQPEGHVYQGDLPQGEAALLRQVDDPYRPPKLEVQQELEEVELPDVSLHAGG